MCTYVFSDPHTIIHYAGGLSRQSDMGVLSSIDNYDLTKQELQVKCSNSGISIISDKSANIDEDPEKNQYQFEKVSKTRHICHQ